MTKWNQKFKDLIEFIKSFSLFIKQCCHIAFNCKKIQKVKTYKKKQKRKNNDFVKMSSV